MPTAAIDVRVSSKGQQDNFSIPQQIEMCQAYCERNGFSVNLEHILTDIFTGASLNRPNFDKLMDLPVDIIVVINQDRLSRADAIDTMQHIRAFAIAGKHVHAVDVGLIRVDGMDQFMTYFRAVMASEERIKIKERTTRGRLGR